MKFRWFYDWPPVSGPHTLQGHIDADMFAGEGKVRGMIEAEYFADGHPDYRKEDIKLINGGVVTRNLLDKRTKRR